MIMQNVKSTILDGLLRQVAPHYCCSCGEIGSLLCESCKYDIIEEHVDACLFCGRPVSAAASCAHCRSGIERSWCVGERSGSLETLINRYKFEYAEAAYTPLGDLILSILPDLPPETVVVPVPTVRAHIRERGYDHALRLARYVANSRHLPLEQPLQRVTTTVQRGADRKQRLMQAETAFRVAIPLRDNIPYLLLDDVVTTGATLQFAAKTLKSAGATTIWAAAVARQPLN